MRGPFLPDEQCPDLARGPSQKRASDPCRGAEVKGEVGLARFRLASHRDHAVARNDAVDDVRNEFELRRQEVVDGQHLDRCDRIFHFRSPCRRRTAAVPW